MIAWTCQDGKHMVHDERATSVCFGDSFSEHGDWKTVNLHIHLECRNTFSSTSDLEIHIASKIFGIHKVGQNIRLVAIHHKPHSDTSNWAFERNTGIHQS